MGSAFSQPKSRHHLENAAAGRERDVSQDANKDRPQMTIRQPTTERIQTMSPTQHKKTLFPLGQIVATSNAAARLTAVEISEAIRRHASGDWGELDEDDLNQNQLCLDQGCRLFSAYGSGDKRFWIIVRRGRRSSITA
jgi:hypothetical protein